MKTHLPFFLAFASTAVAGPRMSASYSVITDTAGAAGGQHGSSASYSHDGCVGDIGGLSTATGPFHIETAKQGYVGQLYDVDHLHINSAPPDTIVELATKQLSVLQVMDDDTNIVADLAQCVWSTTDGPVITVDTAGLALAPAVYEDDITTLRADYGGMFALSQFTVVNSLPDNFGSYSGDGIDDDWQVQYFGQDNPQAAPTLDPDGDGQNNQFEFTAGVTPTDADSRFHTEIAQVPGQPLLKDIIFSPRLPGRTYTIKTSTSLADDSWISLVGGITADSGDVRTITDPDASEARKFYQVEISKP